MDQTAEITQLKAQVAALTQAVAALQFFLHIEPPGTKADVGPGLHIRCTSLALCDPADPTNPERAQALLSGGEEGPLLALNGPNLEPRLILSVRASQARCELFGKDMKQAVLIHSDEASARGMVEVLDAGQPRALLRATDTAGVVSVLHGEGALRGVLRGDARGADLHLLNQEQKTVVKATSDLPGGGSVMVNRKGGDTAILMACHEGDGTLVALNQKKQVTCSLRSTPMGGALLLHAPDEKSTVSLYSTPQGGHVRVHGAAGQTVAELTAEPHGGAVLVCDQQARERAAMRLLNADPQVLLRREDTKVGGAFAMAGGEALVHLHSAAGPLTALEARPDGGRLSILDAAKKLQFVAGAGEGKAWMHMKPEEGGRCAASVGTTETGGFVLVSGLDGVRRAGMGATAEGGQMGVFNDLGIERALIGTMGDGGLVKLNWGGTPGVIATVTEKGGLVVVNDADGNKNVTLPPTVEGD